MHIALYIRISDEHAQGNNFSLESQLTPMTQWCVTHGYTYAVFSEKESASQYGKGLDRTKLQEILTLARQKHIDGIMYYKADRFTRDFADGIVLRRELYQLGIKLFCYLPYPREITSDSELLHVFEDYGSELYVKNLREASMRGYQKKLDKGIFPKGIAPYGYTLSGKKHDTVITIHEEYGKVVYNIFMWAAYEQLTTGQIAKRLTEMGIRSPGQTMLQRGSVEWSTNAVYQILTNEAYIGVWRGNAWKTQNGKKIRTPQSETTPITIPAIIDRVTWGMVQNRPKYEKQHTHTFLLSRFLRCACGAPVNGTNRINHSGVRTYYYTCAGSKIKGKTSCYKYYRCDHVDAEVWRFVRTLVEKPELLRALLRDKDTFTAERIAILETEIASLTTQIDALLQLRIQATHSIVQQRLDVQVDELARQIESLQTSVLHHRNNETQQAYAQSLATALHTFTQAITLELDDIEQSGDVDAMRRIVALLGIVGIMSNDGDKKIALYWRYQVTSVGDSDTRLLVTLGQNICHPTSPHCSRCPVAAHCARVDVERSR